ncbi:hypothetical protein G8O24_03015 [Bradyrhizobium sp. INPA01-394B]|uniref:Methyltransferase FkbM domain-containing protein n=1 Tax=Bradyrhizobium campsiandrae TaxID=1729892 RepID=A0ABR7U9H8_9BRAD|nr:hypothetical protein [Bradyrhizobium campsiandrae]MBC9876316.1 hypothetical protein [Bradyrhizobium campsiandrae]MBC9980161.1 hypothetical protein [Bradyrhizobium campsiandrae]
MRQLIKQNDTLRRLYYRSRLWLPKSEADEGDIIANLTKDCPRTFIEFGFHPVEFNCIRLAQNPEWRGLLVDGSKQQADDARALWPDRIDIVHSFLTLDNIDFIRNQFPQVGVLSIDVDGNDYWFLKALIGLRPSLIIAEYNSTLGHEPITVPYDPAFDRFQKHPRGWYHGASLTALTKLCAEHGYGLAAGSDGSCNAFFTKTGKLNPAEVWKPKKLREQLSGVSHMDQWQSLKDLPYVHV